LALVCRGSSKAHDTFENAAGEGALKVVRTNDKASLMIVEKNQIAALLHAHYPTSALKNSFPFVGLSWFELGLHLT